jgi:hypothetical protein
MNESLRQSLAECQVIAGVDTGRLAHSESESSQVRAPTVGGWSLSLIMSIHSSRAPTAVDSEFDNVNSL